jgi:hypothetical protein
MQPAMLKAAMICRCCCRRQEPHGCTGALACNGSHIVTDVLVVLRLFWSFAQVGLLAWGSGPSMISLMQQEVLA